MTELVLAVNRTELSKQGISPEGLSPINLNLLDSLNYAWLPRHTADDKSNPSLALGQLYPQVIGYFQITNGSRILTYQRKGKEEGLLGKWSIGVGGHVSQEDLVERILVYRDSYPDIQQLIYDGSIREVQEEIGLTIAGNPVLGSQEDFIKNATRVLHQWSDPTSTVHIGLPMEVPITGPDAKNLKLDPKEFHNIAWLTPIKLKASNLEFEPWSQLLVDAM